VRLSLGSATTPDDIDRAAAILVRAVGRLRAALPPGALERIA
jgi:cysteine sulfinate desulfinase/cysteine desulfurase-like protein